MPQDPKTPNSAQSYRTASQAALDILLRARFAEGMAGALEGTVVKHQSPAQLSRQVIPALWERIVARAGDAGVDTPLGFEAGDALSLWSDMGDSRTFATAMRIMSSKFGPIGGAVVNDALFNADGNSTVWQVGRNTGRSPAMVKRFVAGDYAPKDILRVLLPALRNDALDRVRTEQRRKEIMNEEGGQDILVDQAESRGMSEDEWSMVIDRLTADPHSPVAQDFWDWVIRQAQKASTPAVVALFESIADGRERSQESLAAEFGITPGAVSKAKGEFVSYLLSVLASEDVANQPEVMNVLSDANFLHDLYRGRVRGDRVAALRAQADKALRSGIIRLAARMPAHRAALLGLLKTGGREEI